MKRLNIAQGLEWEDRVEQVVCQVSASLLQLTKDAHPHAFKYLKVMNNKPQNGVFRSGPSVVFRWPLPLSRTIKLCESGQGCLLDAETTERRKVIWSVILVDISLDL